jgi:hypothetical protein
MSSPLSTPQISAWRAVETAIEDARRALFPFRFERWLALGFLAFLDQCGSGGGAPPTGAPPLGAGGQGGGGGFGGGPKPDVSQVTDWISGHVGPIVAVTAILLLTIVALLALATWLGSRGTFMYMDAVATGRPEISRAWRENAERANSLFAWRFLVALAVMIVLLLSIAGIVVFAILGSRNDGPEVLAGLGIVVLILVIFLVVVASGFVSLSLRDFVAPIQRSRAVTCGDAIRLFVPLVRRWPGAFVFYVLLKLAFRALLGIAVLFACCLSCGCASLPVVIQTVLQPFFFFERAWSMRLLEQMGFPLMQGPPSPSLAPPP